MRDVLVVRSGSAGSFPRPAAGAGFQVVDKVTHAIVPVSAPPAAIPDDVALAIFTSRVAVKRLFDEAALAARFRHVIRGGRIAAVGEATAEALEDRGVTADLIAAGSGESVLERLPQDLTGSHVLLPRGDDATEELPEGLSRRGALPIPLVLYRKEPLPGDPPLDRRITKGDFAAFCATSPAAAQWLFANASPAAKERLDATPAVVLGRFTGRYLESRGVSRVEVAGQPNFAALLERLGELALAEARPPA